MTQIPGTLRRAAAGPGSRQRSLFDILGALGPAPGGPRDETPFRAAVVLEAAGRGRPQGPPRPTPPGAAPPA